jgi:4-diphosphocytidyl-2-C-methyl-D-erythritol kinase
MPPAAVLCPEISRVVGALVRTPGCLLARMSGSGATCFGIYESETAARRAAADIAANEPRWWVQATELVCDTGALAAHV